MSAISLQELIRVGTHFGHQTSRWNPKMGPYIFKKRNLIHVIDLRETVRGLVAGAKLVEKIAARGDYVLLVGTKRQAKQIVSVQAERCGQPYVSERWPGGLLTNYSTVRRRLERLTELERLQETGEISLYSKKMISTLRRERRKINRNLGGVRIMDRLPGALVLVDPGREYIAVREANKLNIPTVALADTDCDPDNVDIIVPGNDDSIGSIEIFFSYIADAVLSGVAQRKSMMPHVSDSKEPESEAEAQTETEDKSEPVEETEKESEPGKESESQENS